MYVHIYISYPIYPLNGVTIVRKHLYYIYTVYPQYDYFKCSSSTATLIRVFGVISELVAAVCSIEDGLVQRCLEEVNARKVSGEI